jgi:hypothetical protein
MNLAQWLVIITVVVWIVVDIILSILRKETISKVIWAWTAKYPIIAFLAGLICGHLFWK